MKMILLEKIGSINSSEFPMKWVNRDYFPDSKGYKLEIYLEDTSNLLQELILMFYSLFGNLKKEIFIYDKSYWDFCLETWNINSEKYDYTLEGKSKDVKKYLMMLEGSNIDKEYSGSCKCLNWDAYLPIVLNCIINQKAPCSPIYYNLENEFFFYFHHTGSIGFYYKMIT